MKKLYTRFWKVVLTSRFLQSLEDDTRNCGNPNTNTLTVFRRRNHNMLTSMSKKMWNLFWMMMDAVVGLVVVVIADSMLVYFSQTLQKSVP